MIVLTVESFNGAPTQPLSASFDEIGGTIGRDATNQLVLPDPERTVSRIHARVVFRNGSYAIIDHGSNPTSVNGRPLGEGREAPLAHGDHVEIGGFDLVVSYGHAPSQAAGQFDDIWGEPPSPLPPASATPRPPSTGTPRAPHPFPKDWDPMAAPAPAGNYPDNLDRADGSTPRPAGMGLTPSADEQSIDVLYGLAPGSPPANLDPLQPVVKPAPGPMRDDAPEVHSPWEQRPSVTPRPSSAPLSVGASGAIRYSWEEDEDAWTAPAERTAPQPEAPLARPVDQSAGPEADGPPAIGGTAQSVLEPRPEAGALLAALIEGMGTGIRASDIDEQRMRALGQLLREALEGTVQLLQGRAAFKRELRAAVTTIAARENNPLKFSPDAATALQHLLNRDAPGFMTPALAMQDAYDDLRAHQLALMAGMRAALDGLLERFSPEALEGRLARPGALNALVPSTRKAALWEQFSQLYGQISQEASEGFYELFSTNFLRAYEAEVRQLQRSK